MTRSGFVALAGRPNVGKSTLVNRLVGEKVAIVSDRPQTTRRAIRGVFVQGDCELVLVDLPGVQRPRDALTARMAQRVQQELAGADVALLLLNAREGVGAGDRYIARTLAAQGASAVCVAVNKTDRLSKAAVARSLAQAAELGPDWEVFPISARTGAGMSQLLEHLTSQMPSGPFMFGDDARSDQPLAQLLAELVREAVIARTFHELPHAVETVVDEIERPRDGLVRVRAMIWVESESQKRIVIGSRGSMIRAIGSAARKQLESKLDAHVHLDLTVRVRPRWRTNEALLDRLGIT
jgi:GTP-binding protein Era